MKALRSSPRSRPVIESLEARTLLSTGSKLGSHLSPNTHLGLTASHASTLAHSDLAIVPTPNVAKPKSLHNARQDSHKNTGSSTANSIPIFWARMIQRWQSSGLSETKFAQHNHLNVNEFSSWVTKKHNQITSSPNSSPVIVPVPVQVAGTAANIALTCPQLSTSTHLPSLSINLQGISNSISTQKVSSQSTTNPNTAIVTSSLTTPSITPSLSNPLTGTIYAYNYETQGSITLNVANTTYYANIGLPFGVSLDTNNLKDLVKKTVTLPQLDILQAI